MSDDPGRAAPAADLPLRPLELQGAQGVRLVGDEVGPPDGRPVLLLHGGGQNRHAWKGTAADLAERGYRVLSLDARGHGDSEWPEDPRYEMDDLAADLEAVLATLERPPAVVGASMGGMTSLVAQGRAADQLFAALVLVDVTPSMEAEGVLRITGFMMANPEGFATLDDAADAIAAYNPHRRRSARTDGLRRVLRQTPDGRWHWKWDVRFMTSKPELASGDLEAMAARIAVFADEMHRAAGRLEVPTLLVRGAESDLVSERSVAAFLEAAPHADFVEVSRAGHMVAGDQNDAFTEAVVDFLERHAPPRA